MAGIDRVLSPRVPGTVVTTPDFEAQAQLFVSQLEALFYLVLGERGTGDNLEKRGANYDYTSYVEGTRGINKSNSQIFTVQNSGSEIILRTNNEPVLALSFVYSCTSTAAESALRIDESTIIVSSSPSLMPIFRYDYVREPHGKIPSAHFNIHASNDNATMAMLACGTGKRGKNRRKKYVDNGVFPTFSTLHFPVGGRRFRPGLEDILQMLILEFGIDAQDSWLEAVAASREEYRKNQLRALICEYPEIAQTALATMLEQVPYEAADTTTGMKHSPQPADGYAGLLARPNSQSGKAFSSLIVY